MPLSSVPDYAKIDFKAHVDTCYTVKFTSAEVDMVASCLNASVDTQMDDIIYNRKVIVEASDDLLDHHNTNPYFLEGLKSTIIGSIFNDNNAIKEIGPNIIYERSRDPREGKTYFTLYYQVKGDVYAQCPHPFES